MTLNDQIRYGLAAGAALATVGAGYLTIRSEGFGAFRMGIVTLFLAGIAAFLVFAAAHGG